MLVLDYSYADAQMLRASLCIVYASFCRYTFVVVQNFRTEFCVQQTIGIYSGNILVVSGFFFSLLVYSVTNRVAVSVRLPLFWKPGNVEEFG